MTRDAGLRDTGQAKRLAVSCLICKLIMTIYLFKYNTRNKMKTRAHFLSGNYFTIVALLALLITSTARAQTGNHKIVVISDPHVMPATLLPNPNNSDWITYINNSSRKLVDYSQTLFDQVVADIAGMVEQPELILIVGDLTKDGELVSHDYIKTKLDVLNTPTLVIPGNHDLGTTKALIYGDETTNAPTITAEGFASLYADYGYGTTSEREPTTLTYACEPIDGLVVIGIDSGTGGVLSENTLDWVCEKAQAACDNNKKVIAMMHHPLIPHIAGGLAGGTSISNSAYVRNRMADAGINTIFTGHTHISDIAKDWNENKNKTIYDITTGCLCSYPCDYQIVTIDDSWNSMSIATQSITSAGNSLTDIAFSAETAKTRLTNSMILYYTKSIKRQLLKEGMDEYTATNVANQIAPNFASAYVYHAEGNEDGNTDAQTLLAELNLSIPDTYKSYVNSMLQDKSNYGDANREDQTDDRNLNLYAVNIGSLPDGMTAVADCNNIAEEGQIITLSFSGLETGHVPIFTVNYHLGNNNLEDHVIDNGNYTYSFTMPAASVTINAVLGITLTITGYDTGNGGWKFISSPIVGSIAPTAIGNIFSASEYDLYRFNQAAEMEWENYKAHTEGFVLENGKGYLYASKEDVTLFFTGTIYDDNGQVTLSKTGSQGWNLIGNPFGATATIGERDFYRMNNGGTEIIVAEDPNIAAMEGIFVLAASDGETITFTKATRVTASDEKVVVNLCSSTSTVIDRAILRFGEGSTLPKFMLDANNSQIYVPQGSSNYAVVRNAAQGELPLNFKAAKNGEYTITVAPEGVDMDYLHLIDNLTGADIDLLETTDYTFTAKTTDYESRFRLLFSANDNDDSSTGSETFAFICNGEIIITDAIANATLQIVDVMGRVIVSGDAKHCVSTAGMVPGVYVLRLVDGKDVKTQKIVVQ